MQGLHLHGALLVLCTLGLQATRVLGAGHTGGPLKRRCLHLRRVDPDRRQRCLAQHRQRLGGSVGFSHIGPGQSKGDACGFTAVHVQFGGCIAPQRHRSGCLLGLARHQRQQRGTSRSDFAPVEGGAASTQSPYQHDRPTNGASQAVKPAGISEHGSPRKDG